MNSLEPYKYKVEVYFPIKVVNSMINYAVVYGYGFNHFTQGFCVFLNINTGLATYLVYEKNI